MKALQKEIESQTFRTPECQPEPRDDPGQYRRFEGAEQERKKLYELTPIQQFESMMGQTTPQPVRGARGRTCRERSLVTKEQKEEGPEAVKPGTITLPTLPDPSDTAPVDLADWLTVIEPAMTDLSDSSGQWWELVVKESRQWYSHYIQLRPLQRTTCAIEPSAELKKTRWARDEKPTTLKEELVATRPPSPLRLVSRLMVLYQPGGVHERSIILRQLEAGSPSEACHGLRRMR